VGRTAYKHLQGAALAVLLALLVTACGSNTPDGDYGGSHPDYGKALAGAPAPLAKLYSQDNQLLDGGTDAFDARVAELKGYPIVVNKWASWCGPCRAEFPFLQKLSARYGKRVAFIGVDSNDSDDAAKTFLGEYPVPYPSYSDPDQAIAQELKATLGFPSTAYYDRDGDVAYLRQGAYPSEDDFRADIERYALGGSSSG
jgi:cytochrome c biogenesis protein CcmG/thiol:disulfide interchange protein DsbE